MDQFIQYKRGSARESLTDTNTERCVIKREIEMVNLGIGPRGEVFTGTTIEPSGSLIDGITRISRIELTPILESTIPIRRS